MAEPMAGVAKFSADHDRLEAHRFKQALRVAGREVVLGLLQDRPAGRDDDEVADAIGGSEELHGAGQDVGLADMKWLCSETSSSGRRRCNSLFRSW